MAELMRVLVVNTGSSSLKLRLLDATDDILADESFGPDEVRSAKVSAFVLDLGREVDAVGHRVVHSGAIPGSARRVDDDAMEAIASAVALAPQHQAAALAAMHVIGKLVPGTPAVACFDTAFHASLPPAAATYALPAVWRDRWDLRRIGFHGLSHAHVARRAAALLQRRTDPDFRVVSCHLGAGASLCAVLGGRSVDTTMGFTPLEGLVMATRAGSVDPGLLLWLINHARVPARDVARELEESSGLMGLAGTDDMREVVARRELDEHAALAFDVYLHRLVREIAAMTAALGGLDALVFTGGVGEHAPAIRQAAAERLSHLGVAVDEHLNALREPADRDVSTGDADARTLVVQAREDLEIARQTREVLSGHSPA